MLIKPVIPWESPEWDAYVASAPGALVYHTSAWIRIVCEIGGYTPRCFIAENDGAVVGILPAAEVRSRLTGTRLVSLPFSDECPLIADDEATAGALAAEAVAVRKSKGLGFFELRGGDHNGALGDLGFADQSHFATYTIPLTTDTDAVRRTFARKAVRQTISKSLKLGVTVRRVSEPADVEAFYQLYVLNRKHHGIPPQPRKLFTTILERMTGNPEAVLYLAEYEGQPAAGLMLFRFRGVSYAKYEGVDESFRRVLPIHALFWKTIEDAALAGDHTYDFGRTAADNPGLNEFKSRWGTERRALPYFFHPASEGLSVVKSDSLKYRLFTATFRRLPTALSIRIGSRLFRHFG